MPNSDALLISASTSLIYVTPGTIGSTLSVTIFGSRPCLINLPTRSIISYHFITPGSYFVLPRVVILKCIILGFYILSILLIGSPSCFVMMYKASISLAVNVLPLRSFTVVFPLKKSSRSLAKNTGSVFSEATAILG